MTEYRLGPVRDARDREERVKRGDLASAAAGARATQADVETARGAVIAAQTAIAEARRKRELLVGSGSGADQARIALADRFITRRRRDLETALADEVRALAVHARTDAEVDRARSQLTRARAERESIERHFANWRDQRRKLAERRDE